MQTLMHSGGIGAYCHFHPIRIVCFLAVLLSLFPAKVSCQAQDHFDSAKSKDLVEAVIRGIQANYDRADVFRADTQVTIQNRLKMLSNEDAPKANPNQWHPYKDKAAMKQALKKAGINVNNLDNTTSPLGEAESQNIRLETLFIHGSNLRWETRDAEGHLLEVITRNSEGWQKHLPKNNRLILGRVEHIGAFRDPIDLRQVGSPELQMSIVDFLQANKNLRATLGEHGGNPVIEVVYELLNQETPLKNPSNGPAPKSTPVAESRKLMFDPQQSFLPIYVEHAYDDQLGYTIDIAYTAPSKSGFRFPNSIYYRYFRNKPRGSTAWHQSVAYSLKRLNEEDSKVSFKLPAERGTEVHDEVAGQIYIVGGKPPLATPQHTSRRVIILITANVVVVIAVVIIYVIQRRKRMN